MISAKSSYLLLLLMQVQVSIMTDDIGRRNIVDPAVQKECSVESLKTVMEICVRCLSSKPTDRPSVGDVLWNLQFAAQVLQDSFTETPRTMKTEL